MICLMLTVFAHIFPSAWTGINERTFLAIKPDGCHRRLVGEIIKRFERKGFKLVAMKMTQAPEALLKEHYIDLCDRPFYQRLVKYMGSGPVVAMVWQGLDIVKIARVMMGETNPSDSLSGTIRGDFCIDVSRNVIHGSDSTESAKREIALWFKDDELICWDHHAESWIYDSTGGKNKIRRQCIKRCEGIYPTDLCCTASGGLAAAPPGAVTVLPISRSMVLDALAD